MNERNLKVLEQYDMEIRNVRRGRDSYIIDTGTGVVLLVGYNGSKQRAARIEKVCNKVNEAGIRTDIPIANQEGDYVSTDRDGSRYMVKKWTLAQEIDVKSTSDVCKAVKNLAKLHKNLMGFEEERITEIKTVRNFEAGQLENVCKSNQEIIFEKRMRELRKIRRYVKEKKRKNPFELNFMQEYGQYMEMCQEAAALASQDNVQNASRSACSQGCVCHGDYNQHNILQNEEGMITVNFENAMVGIQTEDLYCFMRKILEKHNWKRELAQEMMQTYLKERPLLTEELEDLYVKFLFPEKFWKIANHYYNSKKTWIPDRSLMKLDKMIQQSVGRRDFLEYFKQTFIS